MYECMSVSEGVCVYIGVCMYVCMSASEDVCLYRCINVCIYVC